MRATGFKGYYVGMEIGFDFTGITTPFYCNDGKGNFVLHRRSNNTRDEHGVWDPGSGKLEFGSEPGDNALREVMEEYGCKGTIQEALPAHSIIREWDGRMTHWIALPFFILVDPKEVRICEPHKMVEIGWFRINHLPQPLHSGFRYTLNRYGDKFNPYR